MTRYRCRPVEIEAERFYGLGHPLGTPVGVCMCPKFNEGQAPLPHCHTIQGPVQANVGDFIIAGEGEHWPCEPRRFHEKYEPIE